MTEYIDRDILIKNIEQETMSILFTKSTALKYVRESPAADVAEVVHGRWIPVDEKNDAFDCSECDAMVKKRCNYCPSCGARMDQEG